MITASNFKSEELKVSLFSDGKLDKELACDFFLRLFKPYIQSTNGRPLALMIMNDWDLFTDENTANSVINEVLQWDGLSDISMTADASVVYSATVMESLNEWNKLKQNIKYDSRFLSKLDTLEDLGLEESLRDSEEVFNSQERKQFYRARIAKAKDEKFRKKDLGVPPIEKTLVGRANVEGIPYLYLCTSPETCYYEVRAVYLDRVWLGRFSLKKGMSLRLVNLTPRHRSQQLSVDSEPIAILRNRILMNAISKDLSMPMRRHDNAVIEYLPTQFICEYIRLVLQVDGIMFQSSLKKDGENIVLFNADKVICRKVQEFEVKGINIETAPI